MTTTTLRKILGQRPLHAVAPTTSLRGAAQVMAEHQVGAVVVTQDDVLEGVLSERDLVFKGIAQDADPATTTAEQVMSRDPVTIDIDDPISEALGAKLGETFRHLPVMEDGRVVGLLSYRDIPAEYLMLFERYREMSTAQASDGI